MKIHDGGHFREAKHVNKTLEMLTFGDIRTHSLLVARKKTSF